MRFPAEYQITQNSTNWRGIIEKIMEMDENNLNSLLACFIQEVRKKDSWKYHPGSLASIVNAVQ